MVATGGWAKPDRRSSLGISRSSSVLLGGMGQLVPWIHPPHNSSYAEYRPFFIIGPRKKEK